jgi:hypothetical protein
LVERHVALDEARETLKEGGGSETFVS